MNTCSRDLEIMNGLLEDLECNMRLISKQARFDPHSKVVDWFEKFSKDTRSGHSGITISEDGFTVYVSNFWPWTLEGLFYHRDNIPPWVTFEFIWDEGLNISDKKAWNFCNKGTWVKYDATPEQVVEFLNKFRIIPVQKLKIIEPDQGSDGMFYRTVAVLEKVNEVWEIKETLSPSDPPQHVPLYD